MKRKTITILIFFIIVILTISLFIYSNIVKNSVLYSIDIWKNNLIPSLFPFMVISSILINYGVNYPISEIVKPFTNRLNISDNSSYLIILSLFSGFPLSSKIIYDEYLNGGINKEETDFLINFCFFANPLFIISTIGVTLLKDKKLGLIILLSHYLSNFIIAYLTRNKTKVNNKINIRKSFYKMKNKINKSDKFSNVLKQSILDAINVLLLLLGIITVFLIIINIFLNIINTNILNKGIINGLVEMTSGINKISNINIDLRLKLSLITMFLSFGGLSIHMQIVAVLEKYKLNYKRFLFLRILSSIISVLILNIIIYFLI